MATCAVGRHALLHRRFAWLLWLALVLPVAQVLAVDHALSHVGAGRDVDGKQAPHGAHCDLCLAAAAVTGGAPLATPPVWVPPAGHTGLPTAAVGGVLAVLAVRTYLSRAPPVVRR